MRRSPFPTRATRTATVGWLLLSLQLVAASASAGRVLCLAADGHVSVEIAHGGACTQESARHHRHEAPATTLARDCNEHPCADIVLGQPTSHLRDVECANAAVGVATAAFLPADSHSPARRLSPGRLAADRGDGSVAARRCTVLRV